MHPHEPITSQPAPDPRSSPWKASVSRFVTVCDFRFVQWAHRLAVSLRKSGNVAPLTVFCDDPAAFAPLRQIPSCELRVLPAIRELGAKRAKLAAYTEALAEYGDVVYLDGDIIVLGDLGEIAPSGELRACPDDLSACSFIPDREHPWQGDPGLVNRQYVNSGVLSMPASLLPFFERLRILSLDDDCWRRYTIHEKLYDNHFLCAYLNIDGIPVGPLDAERFNWQGVHQPERTSGAAVC